MGRGADRARRYRFAALAVVRPISELSRLLRWPISTLRIALPGCQAIAIELCVACPTDTSEKNEVGIDPELIPGSER